MPTVPKLFDNTTEPKPASAGLSDKIRLSIENILAFYQRIAWEALRQKEGDSSNLRIDIARLVLPKFLKHLKALLINKEPLSTPQLHLFHRQLEILKQKDLFSRETCDAEVVTAIQDDLKNQGVQLQALFSEEQNSESKEDFISLVEDLTYNPQPLEIKKEASQPTPNQNSNLAENDFLSQEELIKIEAEQSLRASINEVLLDFNGKVDIEAYLKTLLAQEAPEQILLKALAAKPKDDFRFDTRIGHLKAQAFESFEDPSLNHGSQEIIEQEKIGANLILLGNRQCEEAEFLAAIETFKEALYLFQQIHDQQNLACARFNLVVTLIDYGYACLENKEADTALIICQEALKLIRPSYQDSLEEMENLASIHNIYSLAYHQLKSYDKALQYSQAEQSLRVQLSQRKKILDPKLSTVKENLLNILIDKAKFHVDNEEFSDAALTCQTVYKIISLVNTNILDDDSLRKLAQASRICGLKFHVEMNYQKATDLFLLELNAWGSLSQPLAKDKNEKTTARRALIDSSLAEAESLYKRGGADKAVMVCQQALTDGSDKIFPKTIKDKITQGKLLRLLGLSYFNLHHFKQAAQCFENELKLQNELALEKNYANAHSIEIAQNNLVDCHFNYLMKAFQENDFEEALNKSLLLTKIPMPTLFVTTENKNFLSLRQGCLISLLRTLTQQAENHLKNQQWEKTLYTSLVGILSLQQNSSLNTPKTQAKLICLSEKFYLAVDKLLSKAQTCQITDQQPQESSHIIEQVTRLLQYIKRNSGQNSVLLQGLETSQLRLAKTLCQMGRTDFNDEPTPRHCNNPKAAIKKYSAALDILLSFDFPNAEAKLLLKTAQNKIKACETSLATSQEPSNSNLNPPPLAQCRLFHHVHTFSAPTTPISRLKYIGH